MNNSMIAKLLAKENITVEHGNFRTAFFDVEKRVLGLPMWKDMGKNVYDLLVGHEVGHALYTPADGWHDSVKDLGIPRAYINIVEDIRIEKLIQRQYPGLVGSFKRGYAVLDEQDFFSIADKEVNTLHLADRLNIKAKLRDLVNVQFANNEMDVVNQCFAVETWEDVLKACRALYDFIEETANEQQKESASDAMEDSSSDDDVSGTNEPSADDGEASDEDGSDQSGGKGGDDEGGSFSEADSAESSSRNPTEDEGLEETKQEAPSKGAGGDAQSDIHESMTDDAFRNNEESLLDIEKDGSQVQVVKAITRAQVKEMLVPYALADEQRRKYNQIYDIPAFENELKEFNEETKKFVSVMAKEFEMRKMAYRTKRAQSARSGSLDLTKLHSYKYNDDIFNKVTRLADAKSHGMVMFIDFSGSMGSILADTIRQTLILASFCKKVNIPFEVYSFTTGNSFNDESKNAGVVAQFETRHTGIVELLNSNMNKSTYERAYRQLFMLAAKRAYVSTWDGLGGTPLNETVMASRFILADFKTRTKVQKVNAIFLTDGDAQSMYVDEPYYGEDNHLGRARWKQEILLDGKRIRVNGNESRKLTAMLLNELRKEYTVIGYFLAERPYDMRGKIWQANQGYVSDEQMREIRKEYNKNKFIVLDGVLGYDNFFIIKAEKGSLDTSDDEFEVSENAKKGEIQRAFKKHANSKKTNKLFATQFAKMVA
jgi:hypothetical protein